MTQRDLFKVCKGGLTFEYNLPHQQGKEEKSYNHMIIRSYQLMQKKLLTKSNIDL